ncbi:MAG: cytochrome c biogenesis protein CcsA [Leptospiraceae bacterium]|nr:cytochrome c biogenesis protein CcsA [Leptospiraceae bacterium]MCP5501489.1 cytochrome c biogenesis protein CcsA [Leptospiraceae bacterium]
MKLKLSNVFLDYILFAAFVLVFPASVITGLYYPSVILQQGLSHRIFYLHVSVAWVALYAPVLSSFFGLMYLIRKQMDWDILGYSMNKIAFVFSISVLFSGPIWANSAWGTPWDWTDARLQSFLVLVISLVSYFVLRNMIQNLKQKAMVSAFMSILCAFNSLLTWGAIRWIENPGNHPGSVLGKSSMDSDMKLAFWLSVFAYHILFILLFRVMHRHDVLKNALLYIKQTEDV